MKMPNPSGTIDQPPRQGSLALLWRTALGWALLIWLSDALFYLTAFVGAAGEVDTKLWALLATATMIGMMMSVLLMALAWRVRQVSPPARFTVILPSAAAAGFAMSAGVAVVAGTIIQVGVPSDPAAQILWGLNNFPGFAALCGLSAGVSSLLIQHHEMRTREREIAAARLAEMEARAAAGAATLSALRYQLNPHFLFNTLNAISVNVIAGRNDTAELMLEKLSGFLRSTLTSSEVVTTSLEAELESLQAYLEIEGVRFGERLQVEFDCPASLQSAAVPSFILQPLVENAVKFGLATTSRPVTIRISAERETGQRMILRVSDDGDGSAAASPSVGIGLTNVRQRLLAEFGPEASLQAGATSRGYEATIRMPCVVL